MGSQCEEMSQGVPGDLMEDLSGAAARWTTGRRFRDVLLRHPERESQLSRPEINAWMNEFRNVSRLVQKKQRTTNLQTPGLRRS